MNLVFPAALHADFGASAVTSMPPGQPTPPRGIILSLQQPQARKQSCNLTPHILDEESYEAHLGVVLRCVEPAVVMPPIPPREEGAQAQRPYQDASRAPLLPQGTTPCHLHSRAPSSSTPGKYGSGEVLEKSGIKCACQCPPDALDAEVQHGQLGRSWKDDPPTPRRQRTEVAQNGRCAPDRFLHKEKIGGRLHNALSQSGSEVFLLIASPPNLG